MTEHPASTNGTAIRGPGPDPELAKDAAWHHRHAIALLNQAELDATADDETPARLATLAVAHATIAQAAMCAIAAAELRRLADATERIARRRP